jgi:hypothetical protein
VAGARDQIGHSCRCSQEFTRRALFATGMEVKRLESDALGIDSSRRVITPASSANRKLAYPQRICWPKGVIWGKSRHSKRFLRSSAKDLRLQISITLPSRRAPPLFWDSLILDVREDMSVGVQCERCARMS